MGGNILDVFGSIFWGCCDNGGHALVHIESCVSIQGNFALVDNPRDLELLQEALRCRTSCLNGIFRIDRFLSDAKKT